MINEPTIEQMNEAIARFMGGSSVKEHGGKRYVYYPNSCAKDVSELKYHSSWDWLHKVWDKFRVMNFIGHPLVSDFMAHLDRISQYMAFRTITETHTAIYIAIQWYNKQ